MDKYSNFLKKVSKPIEDRFAEQLDRAFINGFMLGKGMEFTDKNYKKAHKYLTKILKDKEGYNDKNK